MAKERKKTASTEPLGESPLTPRDVLRLQSLLHDILRVDVPPDIVEWAESTVDLSLDQTSAYKGKVKLPPWQRAYLREWACTDTEQTTIMSRSRTYKTTLLNIQHLYNMIFYQMPAAAMLESEPKAKTWFSTSMVAMMSMIPELVKYVTKSGLRERFREKTLHLPWTSLMLLGAGAPPTQITLGMVTGDEVDRYTTQNEDLPCWIGLATRADTYDSKKITFASCPTLDAENTIADVWRQGSQGRWHVGCLDCGSLHPASVLGYVKPTGERVGLQWDKDEKGEVIAESLRFVCPRCGRVHVEAEAEAVNEAGRFVHAYENRRAHRSFQIGALGVHYNRRCSWLNCAISQEQGGKGASRTARMAHQNECLGLPFANSVKKHDERRTVIDSRKRSAPSDLVPACVFAGTDMQLESGRKYWLRCVVAVESNGTAWQVDYSRYDDIMTMERDLRERKYCGRFIDMEILDTQGVSLESRAEDLLPYISRNFPQAIGYVGCGPGHTANSCGWYVDTENPRVLHFVDRKWQAVALDAIHLHDGEELWLDPRSPSEFFDQLLSMVPPKNTENAPFEKWGKSAQHERNDGFDALKMALIGRELAGQTAFLRRFPSWVPRVRWPAPSSTETAIPDFVLRRIKDEQTRRNVAPEKDEVDK